MIDTSKVFVTGTILNIDYLPSLSVEGTILTIDNTCLEEKK